MPQGTRILLSTFITNRTAERYPEPDTFWPERWAAINPTAFEYPVFSAGPRNCPGYLFGMAMVKVAVAAIVRRYRIEFPAGAETEGVRRGMVERSRQQRARAGLQPVDQAAMERTLADATSARVSVKATSNEGMGFVGREEGVAALAVATVEEL